MIYNPVKSLHYSKYINMSSWWLVYPHGRGKASPPLAAAEAYAAAELMVLALEGRGKGCETAEIFLGHQTWEVGRHLKEMCNYIRFSICG